MAFGGDIDTLILTFDKLQYIFNGYGPIRDSFIETNVTRKEGRVSDSEFFDRVQQSIMRFSALEFLAIKSIFEIKKSLDKDSVTNITTNSDIPSSANSSQGHSIAAFITAKSLPQPPHYNNTRHEMVNCIYCGNQLKARAKFCTTCGKKV